MGGEGGGLWGRLVTRSNPLNPPLLYTAPYVHKGCYGDQSNRALSIFIASLQKDGNELVNECYRLTKDKGYNVFGVQDGKECWSDPNGECFYDKHGNKSSCRDGTGARWANDVYFIGEHLNKLAL